MTQNMYKHHRRLGDEVCSKPTACFGVHDPLHPQPPKRPTPKSLNPTSLRVFGVGVPKPRISEDAKGFKG